MNRLLVVDERGTLPQRLRIALQARFQLVTVSRIDEVIDDHFEVALIASHAPAPILTCALMLERNLARRVVVLTVTCSLNEAILALRAGASDLIGVEENSTAIVARVEQVIHGSRLQDDLLALGGGARIGHRFPELVGESLEMRRIRRWLESAVNINAAAIVIGESGSGKDLIATILHRHGPRRRKPFVRVQYKNGELAAPAGERVALGAASDGLRKLLAHATGGTIYFDCISEIPLDVQRALVDVIGCEELAASGHEEHGSPGGTRVVVSSTEDLDRAVQEGRLVRELSVVLGPTNVRIPPLRERGGDVLTLAYHFIREARCTAKPIVGLTPGAARALLRHSWPGNVRELRQCIVTALTLARRDYITTTDLDELRGAAAQLPLPARDVVSWHECEREHILRILQSTRGNKSLAARYLGLDRKTLQRKLREYDL